MRVVDELVTRLNGDGENVSVKGAVTVTESVPEVTPVPEAVIVSLPVVLPAVTVTVALVAPAAIVTLPAEKLTRPEAVVRLMICPPVGAGLLRLTVRVVFAPAAKVSGEGARDAVGAATVTASDAELRPAAETVTVSVPVVAEVLTVTLPVV